MNIQIWVKSKCFDSKKAERHFKERKIKAQIIDVARFGMGKRELENVLSSLKNVDLLFDSKSALYEQKHVAHLMRTKEDKMQLLLENPSMFVSPIVRNGNQATIGFCPEVWKLWV